MTRKHASQAPAHLSESRRELWASIASGYRLSDDALEVLTVFATALDRADEARLSIESEGVLVRDRFDQWKPNPAAVVERDAQARAVAAWKALDLETSSSYGRKR